MFEFFLWLLKHKKIEILNQCIILYGWTILKIIMSDPVIVIYKIASIRMHCFERELTRGHKNVIRTRTLDPVLDADVAVIICSQNIIDSFESLFREYDNKGISVVCVSPSQFTLSRSSMSQYYTKNDGSGDEFSVSMETVNGNKYCEQLARYIRDIASTHACRV